MHQRSQALLINIPQTMLMLRQDFSAPSQSCSEESKYSAGLYIRTYVRRSCLYGPSDSLYLRDRDKWHVCELPAHAQGYPANECCLDAHTSYIHTYIIVSLYTSCMCCRSITLCVYCCVVLCIVCSSACSGHLWFAWLTPCPVSAMWATLTGTQKGMCSTYSIYGIVLFWILPIFIRICMYVCTYCT